MIKLIKETAQQCEVEKVVLIPVPDHLGHGGPIIKCHGKSSEDFFNQMNRVRLPKQIIQQNVDLIERYEKEFGVIIYENEN